MRIYDAYVSQARRLPKKGRSETLRPGKIFVGSIKHCQEKKGGKSNVANFALSVIGGGLSNKSSGLCSFIGGGNSNVNNALAGVIGGGDTNTITGACSAILGGAGNSDAGIPFIGMYANGLTASAAVPGTPSSFWVDELVAPNIPDVALYGTLPIGALYSITTGFGPGSKALYVR